METNELIKQRSSVHGDAEEQFVIAQELKNLADIRFVIRKSSSSTKGNKILTEALDMIFVKISRILTGDERHKDHWDDIAGYATIASNYLEKEINSKDKKYPPEY